ncbi:sperm microtubule associated protein 2-like [Nerophis lumbriciformis]|uniref:sperm microtubule associated protein 2-like n=1 Tax=Nerophis lumbriciformis TaxID=546530 RepID=UPI003BAADBDE
MYVFNLVQFDLHNKSPTSSCSFLFLVLLFKQCAASYAIIMTTRIQQLAQPKPDRLRYPDRRSVHWLDKSPSQRSKLPTENELTPRWAELCRSKTFQTQLLRSPMWKVSESALRAVASERLCRLAQPRGPPPSWQPALPLPTPLRKATQTAVATPRICQLARPKTRPLVAGHGCQLGTPKIPRKATARTELLATPKQEHPKHEGGRPVCWPVSRAARTYVPSQRLVALSSPKQRKSLFEGYKQYGVSSADPSPLRQHL